MEQKTKNASQEEKLKAVIDKAVTNGFDDSDFLAAEHHFGFSPAVITAIVFTHDFAKAFWGEQFSQVDNTAAIYGRLLPCLSCGELHTPTLCWQLHLERLALTPPEERIDYLYRFLDGSARNAALPEN